MTPLIEAVTRALFLPMLMVAAALLVGAASRPGDGFSAGVVAALAVLIQYVVFGHREVAKRLRLLPVGPTAAVGGLAVMVGVALVGPLLGEPILTHLPPAGEPASAVGELTLQTATLFDLGIACLVFGVLVSIFEMLAEIGDRAA